MANSGRFHYKQTPEAKKDERLRKQWNFRNYAIKNFDYLTIYIPDENPGYGYKNEKRWADKALPFAGYDVCRG